MRIQRTALVIAGAGAVAGCGAATPSPRSSPAVSATSSPTPTSASVVGTPSPTPTHPSFEPLLVAFTDRDPDPGVLMLASGQTTVRIPSGPIIGGYGTLSISGPFGGRMIGTDGQQIGSSGPVSIVAVSSDGSLATLEKNVAGLRQWLDAMMVRRGPGRCRPIRRPADRQPERHSTSTPTTAAEPGRSGVRPSAQGSRRSVLWRGRLPASWRRATMRAAVPPTPRHWRSHRPSSWILRLARPRVSQVASERTAISKTSSTTGQLSVHLMVRQQRFEFIAPDGTQTNYSVPGLTSRRCLNGGVALSPDAGFAALSILCPTSSGARLVLLDLASGHVVAVTGASNLSPTLWTPAGILIATELGAHKTYSVATSGVATLINARYAAQTSSASTYASSPAQPPRAPARTSRG